MKFDINEIHDTFYNEFFFEIVILLAYVINEVFL